MTITVVQKSQIIRVDPVSNAIAVISAGPPGGTGGDPAAVKLTGNQTVAGEKTFTSDMHLPSVLPDDGTVDGGVIRDVHSIQIPWAYTQETDPTDPALGTAVRVDVQVQIDDFQGLDGPNFSTGLFGPRGIYDVEGVTRYGVDQSIISIAPIAFADTMALANDTGNDRVLTPSWGYMSARSYIAEGGVVTLHENDTNQGGAAFVSTPLYCTIDTGEIDGLTNEMVDTGFLFGGLYAGNVDMQARIGVDIQPVKRMADIPFAGILEPGEPLPAWYGTPGISGTVDGDNATLQEEIGVRVQKFIYGVTKLGMRTAHPIEFLSEDLSHSGSVHTLMYTAEGNTRVLTLDASGCGFAGMIINPTLLFEFDPFLFGSLIGVSVSPILTHPAGEARTIGVCTIFHASPKFRGNTLALSANSYTGFSDSPTSDILSGGTVAWSACTSFVSAPTAGAGVTITTRKAIDIQDIAGAGAATTNIGIDIAGFAKGTNLIGLRNASTEVATPGVQTIANAAGTIVPNAKCKRLNNVSGGAVTLTSTPTIADGQDGQILIVFNGSANSVTLTHGGATATNLRLDGGTNKTLAARASIMLMFSSTVGDWIQIGQVVTPT